MEKENNGYNEEFDYQGVPAGGTYETTYVNTDQSGAASYINAIVQKGVLAFQIIAVILGIICCLKGILNIMQNRKFKKEVEGDEDNKIRKKAVIPYFISSIFLLFINLCCSVITNFALKPIIYIYPEEEKEVTIKVKNPEKLTCTYPKYVDGWNVLAKPNGEIVDLKTNRKLYALYWEGLNTTKHSFEEGFIVEGDNVSKFLEEKLEILGLNEREAEEFIVYWLPLMEKNKYNYIRFETMKEIEDNMQLEIMPKPETLIRINMEFKAIRKPIDIREQKLEKVERKGYTVVEWGGTKI